MSGPLTGVRVLELAGIGPGPFCGMMLADHGADVVVVQRPGAEIAEGPLQRSRRFVTIDAKDPAGVQQVRALAREADGLIEGFRPGTMERLGLGPDILLRDNPRLVYGRMTGWGQTGPLAHAAGHDINYIALSGVLHGIGRAGERPVPPVNLVGDFGGGGLMLAFGMVAALLEAARSGRGQVIDCAMTDGSALLAALLWGMMRTRGWRDERGVNLLDGGASFYDTYETSDGRHVAIGAIETQFYTLFLRLTGLQGDPLFKRQMDPAAWPTQRERLAELFRTKTRDEWCLLLENTDVCFAPVLSMTEAPSHAHNDARGTFADIGGIMQPMPAPRYSRTACVAPAAAITSDVETVRREWCSGNQGGRAA